MDRKEPRKILFVDDEPEWCSMYLEELGGAFAEVIVKHDAAQALEYYEKHLDIDAIVLDVMMPTPIGISSTLTNEGLDTGLYLLEQWKVIIVAHKCPVVILTNRGKELFQERLGQMKLPNEYCEVRIKGSTPCRMLPVILKQMIDSLR